MTDKKKLKLPTKLKSDQSGVSDDVRSEMLKTERASINANQRVEVARLDVAKEAISAAKAVLETLKSYHALEATRVEWEGRVYTAEIALRNAALDLETAQEHNKSRMEELGQLGEAQKRLLALFDEILNEVTSGELQHKDKTQLRQDLLRLSDSIVQLRK